MNISIADTSGLLDHARVAELLARRWTENRRHFITVGTIRRGGLQAYWQLGPAHTLSLHWARRTAFEFERGAA